MRAYLAAALLAAAPLIPSASATTWTITPGGTFTPNNSAPHFSAIKDLTAGQRFECSGVTTAGTFKAGSGRTNPIGSITTIELGGGGIAPLFCTGDGLTFDLTWAVPFPVRGFSYNATTDTAYGSFQHMSATISAVDGGPACSAVIDGTGPSTASGKLRFEYFNSQGEFRTLGPGADLHFYNVTGCNGVISEGDSLWWRAWWWVKSGADQDVITSP